MCKLNTLNNKLLIKTNPISKKQVEWAVVLSLMRAVWALLTIIGWTPSSISVYMNTWKHCYMTLFFNIIMLNYCNQMQCYVVIKLLNQKMTLLYHIQPIHRHGKHFTYEKTHTQCSKHFLILRFLITKREILLISSFLYTCESGRILPTISCTTDIILYVSSCVFFRNCQLSHHFLLFPLLIKHQEIPFLLLHQEALDYTHST